ncbi:hypothetical protein [Paenibacillus motobuensis]|uniref:Uncharacterized protein n=1 Tax=Paenibacillus motobuensis TaxID=295324 RepID=A0ABP3I701_9BACL
MEVENEQRLMDEIRQGNKDAFRTLVNPLIPKAYKLMKEIEKNIRIALSGGLILQAGVPRIITFM